MGAIALTNASHSFSDDVFGFFLRNGLAGGVHFSKVLPQFVHHVFNKTPGTHSHSASFQNYAVGRFASLKTGAGLPVVGSQFRPLAGSRETTQIRDCPGVKHKALNAIAWMKNFKNRVSAHAIIQVL